MTCASPSFTIHGPCRRFRGDQNDEDTRKFCGKFVYNAIASTDNAQHKNCPSSGIDDRPGRDLFRVLKRSPISQPHTLGLRRGYSDGKAVGSTAGLQQRLYLHWRISKNHTNNDLPDMKRALKPLGHTSPLHYTMIYLIVVIDKKQPFDFSEKRFQKQILQQKKKVLEKFYLLFQPHSTVVQTNVLLSVRHMIVLTGCTKSSLPHATQ